MPLQLKILHCCKSGNTRVVYRENEIKGIERGIKNRKKNIWEKSTVIFNSL